MKNDTRENLLKQFSEYVYYSSSEYKYNKSYLEGKISQFTKYMKKYNKKKRIVENYRKSLESYSIENFDLNIRIEFDESFKLSFEKNLREEESKILNSNSDDSFKFIFEEKEWKIEDIKPPNIMFLENQKIYIKIYFLDEYDDIVFSNYYLSEKNGKIKEFIQTQITLFRKEQEYVNK